MHSTYIAYNEQFKGCFRKCVEKIRMSDPKIHTRDGSGEIVQFSKPLYLWQVTPKLCSHLIM